MSLNKFHLLASTALSLTLGTILATSANAAPVESSWQVAAINDDYSGEAVMGTIKAISGNMVTVEFADGTTETYWVSRADLQRWSLIEGKSVLVADEKIVGVATEVVVAESTYRSRTAELWRQLEEEETQQTTPPRNVTIEQRPTTSYPRVEEQPVRALW